MMIVVMRTLARNSCRMVERARSAARSALLFFLIAAVDPIGFAPAGGETQQQSDDSAPRSPFEPAVREASHEVPDDRRDDEQRGNGEQKPRGLQSGGFPVLLRRLRHVRCLW